MGVLLFLAIAFHMETYSDCLQDAKKKLDGDLFHFTLLKNTYKVTNCISTADIIAFIIEHPPTQKIDDCALLYKKK